MKIVFAQCWKLCETSNQNCLCNTYCTNYRGNLLQNKKWWWLCM